MNITKIRDVLQSSFHLHLASGVNIVTGFILSVLFARFVDQTLYGQYVLVYSLIGIFGSTSLMGLRSILPFSISQGYGGMFLDSIRLTFLGSLVGSIGLLVTGIYYALPGKPALTFTFSLVALLFPFLNTLSLYPGVLVSKKKFKLQGIYALTQALIPNVAIMLAIIYKSNLISLIFVGLITQILLNAYFSLKTTKLLPNNNKSPIDVTYGIKLSFLWLLPTIMPYIDKILLAKYLGFENVAIYAFATLIPQQITAFLKNFQPIFIEKIGSYQKNDLHRHVSYLALQFSLGIGLIVLIYILTAPYIFRIFYPKYVEGIFISQLYASSLLFFPASLLTQMFHKLRKIKDTTVYTVITSCVKIILLLYLVPKAGIIGASFGVLLSAAFEYIFAFLLINAYKHT